MQTECHSRSPDFEHYLQSFWCVDNPMAAMLSFHFAPEEVRQAWSGKISNLECSSRSIYTHDVRVCWIRGRPNVKHDMRPSSWKWTTSINVGQSFSLVHLLKLDKQNGVVPQSICQSRMAFSKVLSLPHHSPAFSETVKLRSFCPKSH